MSRFCPNCGSGDSSTERRADGDTYCHSCTYRCKTHQWDIEQTKAEYEAGVSSTLRGNPLEIEKRYRAMEQKLEEAVQTIDNLVAANEAVHQNEIGMQVMYSELKHENEKLELEILDLKILKQEYLNLWNSAEEEILDLKRQLEGINPFTGCKCKLYESERSVRLEEKINEQAKQIETLLELNKRHEG